MSFIYLTAFSKQKNVWQPCSLFINGCCLSLTVEEKTKRKQKTNAKQKHFTKNNKQNEKQKQFAIFNLNVTEKIYKIKQNDIKYNEINIK